MTAGLDLAPSERIAVAMSGGVDSSTAAVKLSAEGLAVLGVTLRLHDAGQSSTRTCCTTADIDDAKHVAALAGFPHLVLDMRAEFRSEVVERFCREYLRGRTPNPCVDCNRYLRFRRLLTKIGMFGAAKLATGHYVRIVESGGVFELRRAADRKKDQSYVFWAADQQVLGRLLTPLGDLRKDEVRDIAAGFGLPVASKPDSQDVCFIPDGDYPAFVSRTTGYEPARGAIEDLNGRVLGEHKGLINYTVGQRRGLGLSMAQPFYVLAVDYPGNRLVVGPSEQLKEDRFTIKETNFIMSGLTESPFTAEVMTRYNSDPVPAVIHPAGPGAAVVELKEPFGPIAPGQSAVLYDGDLVLGGGIID